MGTWVLKMPLNLIGMCFRVDTACPGGPESNMNMEHLSWGRHLRVPPRQSLLRKGETNFLGAGVGFPLQPSYAFLTEERGDCIILHNRLSAPSTLHLYKETISWTTQ